MDYNLNQNPQNSQPQQPEPQKHISTLVGSIIIIIVAIIAFGGVFAYQYFKVKQFQSVETALQTQQILDKQFPLAGEENLSDETAGWKTYTNTEYGFSFKYPEILILSAQSENYLEMKSQTDDLFFAYIELKNNSENLTAEQYADRAGAGAATPVKNVSIENITIDGITGKKVTKDNPPSDADPTNPNYVSENTLNDTTIYLVKGSKLYVFEIYNKDGLDVYDSEIFNRILSTFKFIP